MTQHDELGGATHVHICMYVPRCTHACIYAFTSRVTKELHNHMNSSYTYLRAKVQSEKQGVFVPDQQGFLQIDQCYFIHLRGPLIIGLLFIAENKP